MLVYFVWYEISTGMSLEYRTMHAAAKQRDIQGYLHRRQRLLEQRHRSQRAGAGQQVWIVASVRQSAFSSQMLASFISSALEQAFAPRQS
jgi:hypothetical protein